MILRYSLFVNTFFEKSFRAICRHAGKQDRTSRPEQPGCAGPANRMLPAENAASCIFWTVFLLYIVMCISVFVGNMVLYLMNCGPPWLPL